MTTLMNSTFLKRWTALLPITLMIVLFSSYSLMAENTNQPAVVFLHYSNALHYSDGSRGAVFVITNTTENWLDSSPGLAKIQIETTGGGWTDFSSKSPDDFILLTGWDGAEPHQVWSIYRHVPQQQGPWRLHVHYTIRGDDTFPKDKGHDVYSQEMQNEPAQ
jgi:hypothetical protein